LLKKKKLLLCFSNITLFASLAEPSTGMSDCLDPAGAAIRRGLGSPTEVGVTAIQMVERYS
jgi:hypothetical protein